jgi:hypothetical protein
MDNPETMTTLGSDPVIVAFYDKRIYKKVTIEVIVPK